MLLEAGAAILGVAFLVKAGMWPLGFWLPTRLSAASAAGRRDLRDPDQGRRLYPAAAFPAAVRRAMPGDSAGFGERPGCCRRHADHRLRQRSACLPRRRWRRLAGYQRAGFVRHAARGDRRSAMVAVIGGALFYLVSSTLDDRRVLPADRTGRARPRAGADVLAVTSGGLRRAVRTSEAEDEEVGIAIPARWPCSASASSPAPSCSPACRRSPASSPSSRHAGRCSIRRPGAARRIEWRRRRERGPSSRCSSCPVSPR